MMAQHADTAHTDATDGFPPITLLANSYDLHELEKATLHAESLKTDDGRAEAFAKIATDQAQLQEVVEGHEQPALPEGTTLAEVEDANGRTVTAPVSLPAEDEDDAAVDAVKTKRTGTKKLPADETPPSNPNPPAGDAS